MSVISLHCAIASPAVRDDSQPSTHATARCKSPVKSRDHGLGGRMEHAVLLPSAIFLDHTTSRDHGLGGRMEHEQTALQSSLNYLIILL